MTQIEDHQVADHMELYYKKALMGGGQVRTVEDYYMTDETSAAMASGNPQPKHYQRVPTGVKDYYRPLGEEPAGDGKTARILKNFVANVEKNSLPSVTEPVVKQKEEERKLREEQQPEDDKEEETAQCGEDEFEVRNGYLIYPVKFVDTLEGVSIRFQVSKDAIRIANNFYGDDIWMKKELRVPYTGGMKYRKKEPTNIKELEQKL